MPKMESIFGKLTSTFALVVLLFTRFTGSLASNVTNPSTTSDTSPHSSTSLPSPVSSNSTIVISAQCSSGRFMSTGECCAECAAGFGVHRQCSNGNTTNTICTSCEPEVSFSSVSSHIETCRPCRRCGHTERMVSPCTLTHDTVCECASNFFRIDAQSSGGVASACSQCMICPSGFGVKVPCSPSHNLECEECSNGTYSDSTSSTEKCKPCSMCKKGSSVVAVCTRFSDTICTDNFAPTPTYEPVNNHVTTTSWVHGYDVKSSGFSVVPIFCSLLGLVIFGLLAYVIFKKWSFKKMKLRHTQKMTRSNSCHTDVEANTISVLSLKTGQSFFPRDSPIGAAGVGILSRQPLMAVPSTTPYQQLPSDKRAELEGILSVSRIDGHDWRGLARELGFTDVDIVHISQTSTGATPPARAMFVVWQSRNSKDSTVGVLVEALRRIRRNDVADLIPIFTYSAYHFQNS